MLKVRLFISDVANVMGAYDHVQIGRAATSADAASQSGTFTSLGAVVTLSAGVESYSYVDVTGAVGQWYVSRYYNAGTAAAGEWSDPFAGAAMGYLTAAEFRDYDMADLTNSDGSAMTDDQLDRHIATATRLVDSEVGFEFTLAQSTEQHPWRQSRRIYPWQRPIVSMQSLTVTVGPNQSANFDVSSCVINTGAHYIEVAFLNNATYSLFALTNLWLSQPIANLTYTHGYATMPEPVKVATALTTAEVLAERALNQQGLGGLNMARIGGYTMSRKTSGSGFPSLEVPPAAKLLLARYSNITLR